MPRGLYVHIPFCPSRCGYCDFVTTVGQASRLSDYLAALERELAGNRGARVSTIFLGGGTPSMLSGRQMSRLMNAIRSTLDVAPDAEVTVEANPGTLGAGDELSSLKLCAYREAGVNRISFGAQTFDEAGLTVLGRLHDARAVTLAVMKARAAGFANLNLDLLYGWPGQTLSSWNEDVRKAIELAPQHLSVYSLILEPDSPFGRAGVQAGGEDLQADMFEQAEMELESAGYRRYELSNFALPGFECRHNLIYWRSQEYLGVGCGAVSFMDGRRWKNPVTLDAYLAMAPPVESERLTGVAREGERLTLALRLSESAQVTPQACEAFGSAFNRLVGDGLLEWAAPRRDTPPPGGGEGPRERVRLTRRGRMLANRVFLELLP